MSAMDAKILRKWGLKSTDSRDSLPGSPVSSSSRDTRSATPVDVRGLQAWLPPIPPFDRQRISADVLEELRYACAVILKDTTPDEAELDQTDPLEEYKKSVARVEKHDRPKDPRSNQKSQKARKDSPRSSGHRQSSKQAQNVGPGALHVSTKDISSQDRLQGVESMSSFPQPPKREPYKSASLTQQDYYRPQPHKAASPDYIVAHESSRTSTTNPGSATTRSARDTAITSFSQSPHDTLRNSNQRSIGYPSNQGVQHEALPIRPGSSSQANASHTVWVTGGRSQKEHEESVAPPTLRKVESRASLRSQSGLRSRAESIRDNIKEYIRPGSSRGSSRPPTSRANEAPTFAQPETSRPDSRASRVSTSAENKRSWWKGGGLRRKGSFTSSRDSTGSNGAQEPTSPSKEGGLDLDKSLPPMPSLDSYVEPVKEPKLHISQLMVPVTPAAAPAAPQNSHASPANVTSPMALRSPSSVPAALSAQTSPMPLQTSKQAHVPYPSHGRSAHSPALTPGGAFPPQSRQADSRPKSAKSRPQTTSRKRTDASKSEAGNAKEPVVDRTFYSPAHKSAVADLTQFSDQWREDLLQKDEERRLKHERDREMMKAHRKRMLETKKGQEGEGVGKSGKEGAGLKNRLSRMFGHKSGARQQAVPRTEGVAEAAESIEEHAKGREITAN